MSLRGCMSLEVALKRLAVAKMLSGRLSADCLEEHGRQVETDLVEAVGRRTCVAAWPFAVLRAQQQGEACTDRPALCALLREAGLSLPGSLDLADWNKLGLARAAMCPIVENFSTEDFQQLPLSVPGEDLESMVCFMEEAWGAGCAARAQRRQTAARAMAGFEPAALLLYTIIEDHVQRECHLAAVGKLTEALLPIVEEEISRVERSHRPGCCAFHNGPLRVDSGCGVVVAGAVGNACAAARTCGPPCYYANSYCCPCECFFVGFLGRWTANWMIPIPVSMPVHWGSRLELLLSMLETAIGAFEQRVAMCFHAQ